jgi:hypothetical protein
MLTLLHLRDPMQSEEHCEILNINEASCTVSSLYKNVYKNYFLKKKGWDKKEDDITEKVMF